MSTVIDDLPEESNPLIAGDYYMPQILINLLRSHFRGPAEYRVPALRGVIYEDQIAQGGVTDKFQRIKICHWSEFDPSGTNITPAIICKDNDCRSARIGMGDRHMAPSIVANTSHYSRAWAGSLTFFAIAKKPALVKILSWEIANVIEALLPEIRDKLDMMRIELASIGAVKKIREFPNNFASPVTVEYTFIRCWGITPAAPTLNHIVYNDGF